MTLTMNYLIKTLTLSLLFMTLVLSSDRVLAHEPSYIDQPTQLNIKSAMSVQNKSIVETDQAWLIPGVTLGNEATPKSQGAAIDDIQLTGRLNLDDDYYLGGKLGFHQHEGGGEIELENFWLGKYFTFDSGILRFDAGQMSSRVTPTANHHPSQDNFATTPLLADVFFGGHHKDIGASANWFMAPIHFGESSKTKHQAQEHHTESSPEKIGFAKIEFGIEAWNGNAWPSTSSEGNLSIFSKYHGEFYSLKTDAGIWYAAGKAVNRLDTRYNSDHHSTNNISTPDGAFTGDIKTFGSYLELSHPIFSEDSQSLSWQANWEWIQMQQDGVFSDESQSAQMAQTLDGYSMLLGLTFDNEEQQHRLFVQHEMLVVNNDFTNATDTFLNEQNLVNNGFEPNRTKLGYHWRWNESFTLRVETILDKTQLESIDNEHTNKTRSEQIWSIGLIWQHNLL